MWNLFVKWKEKKTGKLLIRHAIWCPGTNWHLLQGAYNQDVILQYLLFLNFNNNL